MNAHMITLLWRIVNRKKIRYNNFFVVIWEESDKGGITNEY